MSSLAHGIDPLDPEVAGLWEQWRARLVAWACSGQLGHAARIALRLPADHPGLDRFVAAIRQADFSDLPAIRVLDGEAMENSPCAYAPQKRLILINRDWLDGALEEQVFAVLSEQLGHHLDVLFNPVDTPGDEGELFLECLRGEPSAAIRAMFSRNEEIGVVHLQDGDLEVEEAGVGATCLDPRDLPSHG